MAGSPGRRSCMTTGTDSPVSARTVQNLRDRIADAGSNVEGPARIPPHQQLKGCDMRGREIVHMNIVANRRSVRGVIIGAENREIGNMP